MRILLFVLLAAGALGALWWFARPGTTTPAGIVEPAPAPVLAPPPPADADLVRPTQGERTADELPPEPEPVEPEPDVAAAGLEDGAGPPAVAIDFDQKYAGWARTDKVERLILLERELRGELDEAFKACFDRGDYESHRFDTSKRDGGGWDVLTQRAPEGLLGRGRSQLDPTPPGAQVAATTGEYHFAVLDTVEFAPVYERVAERDWLRKHLSERRP